MIITVLGTSNSVMLGNYVDALANCGHKVTNLSVGKVNILYHIATFLRKYDGISKSDCLILDFSPNLSNWIRKDGGSLFKHVYNFYMLIASLNIPVIDINFPSLNQNTPGSPRNMASFIRRLDKKFGFIALDLLKYAIPESYWKDKNHLKAHISYGIGLVMGTVLKECSLAAPYGGSCTYHPYTIVDTKELSDAGYKIQTYASRRIAEDYILVTERFSVKLRCKDKRLIGIGTYTEKDISSGMQINEIFKTSCQVKVHTGSLLSKRIMATNGRIEILPLKGRQELAFYGSQKKESVDCSGSVGLSYLLLYDESTGRVRAEPARGREAVDFAEKLAAGIQKLFIPLTEGKSKGRLIEKGPSYATLPFASHPAGIRISGSGNVLWISPNADISKMKISIAGNNNVVIIDDDCILAGKIVINGHRAMLHIGRGTVSIDLYLLCVSDTKITIGKYCLISRLVEIRTSDAHSLIDLHTLERINKNGDICIGNHVWLCLRSIINKNVTINDDVVVACNAFVNKSIPESHVVAAGIPAAIVKRNVSWSRKQRASFTEEEVFFWKDM